jgi:TRAP-type C4-dicarboxylate transport system permease large subunit
MDMCRSNNRKGSGDTALFGIAFMAFSWILNLFILYLILGMFIEGISMMLLTVPVIYTSVLAIGLDSVWFGVMLVIFIELAALTPPVGLNLFAIQSVSGGWPMAQVESSVRTSQLRKSRSSVGTMACQVAPPSVDL